jgi:hypothetical protein
MSRGPARQEKDRMPQWALHCKNCNKRFTHTRVDRKLNLRPYDTLWPDKPAVPDLGMTMKCPHCRTDALYRRFELTYHTE